MTQNKFWLVCRYNEQNTVMIEGVFNNFQGAKELSDYLARTQGYNEFYICESTHHFKADVNVIETSFEATTEESLAVTEQDDLIDIEPVLWLPKYKIGDEVLYENLDKEDIVSNWRKGVVIDIIENKYVKIENKVTTDIFTYLLNSKYVKLAKPTIDKTATAFDKKHSFKAGDCVRFKNLADDYTEAMIATIDDKEIVCITERHQTMTIAKEDIDILELII
jgi:hypothetical protein